MRLILVLMALAITMTPALSETIRRDVRANTKSGVGVHVTFNRSTCVTMALPDFKITSMPENGKVSFEKGQLKMDERAGNCAGRTTKGTVIYYTPNKGFRGTDTFKLSFQMPVYDGGSVRKHISNKYIITVK